MADEALTNQELAATLHAGLAPLDIVPLDQELPQEPSIGDVRRRRRSRHEDTIGVLTLLDIDGVLIWEEGAVTSSTSPTRRRRGGTATEGEVVTQLKFEKDLGVNQIAGKLQALDGVLTPNGPAKLLRWDRTTWTPAEVTDRLVARHALVVVHGTFSNSANLFTTLQSTDHGRRFLDAISAYDEVLSFDHATLSRSPFVNALDLERLLRPHDLEDVDVVCHSRGGLVTRWWLEVLNRKPFTSARVVFVGCPLRGTSLADPQSLRHGLNLLTNVGKVLGQAAGLVPLLTAAGGLMQIVTCVTGFAARTPLLDAAVAMIPGLAAQSRTRTNTELDALNALPPPSTHEYAAVLSDFQPEDVKWRFWRLFNVDRLANAAGDYLVFQQENDVVVDTSSMTHHVFGPAPLLTDAKKFCYFQKSPTVFHTTYFSDAATLDFIRACFRV